MLRDRSRFTTWRRGPFSRDAYFIVDRAPTSKYGLAVSGLSRDQDAVLGRATRHLFLAPWRGKTLVGVWHRLFAQHPDTARIEPDELQQWLDELNAVNPELKLSRDEITYGNCGLVPFGEHADAQSLQFGKESRFIDHRRTHGIGGLVTLIGIRYTMARADGELALDMLLAQRERQPPRVDTTLLPLAGGDIDNFTKYCATAKQQAKHSINALTLESLLCNHGSRYERVTRLIDSDPTLAKVLPGSHVIAAEIQHAVRSEMAVTLEDVVLRRTDLSGHEHPGQEALRIAAQYMGALLQWPPQRISEEIAATELVLANHHAVARTQMSQDQPESGIGSMLAELSA